MSAFPGEGRFLVPALVRGDIVIRDNLGSHKGQAVRRAIRAAGAKLFFLPRSSPDLNPNAQVFSRLKTLRRKTDPRTPDATWRQIGALLDRFTAEECANDLAWEYLDAVSQMAAASAASVLLRRTYGFT